MGEIECFPSVNIQNVPEIRRKVGPFEPFLFIFELKSVRDLHLSQRGWGLVLVLLPSPGPKRAEHGTSATGYTDLARALLRMQAGGTEGGGNADSLSPAVSPFQDPLVAGIRLSELLTPEEDQRMVDWFKMMWAGNEPVSYGIIAARLRLCRVRCADGRDVYDMADEWFVGFMERHSELVKIAGEDERHWPLFWSSPNQNSLHGLSFTGKSLDVRFQLSGVPRVAISTLKCQNLEQPLGSHPYHDGERFCKQLGGSSKAGTPCRSRHTKLSMCALSGLHKQGVHRVLGAGLMLRYGNLYNVTGFDERGTPGGGGGL